MEGCSTVGVLTEERPQLTERRLYRPSRSGGSEGNSRLTALTAVVLLVLLAVEGGTLLSLQAFLSWHIFVGMLLVPIVLLKLASTGHRFLRYYTRKADYVLAGPPSTPLRLLGPVVILSTAGLFATGVALAVLGPTAPFVLLLHKASFAVWLAAMTLHVLGHIVKLPSLARADLRRDGTNVRGGGARLSLVASAVVAGAILAVATLPLASQWVGFVQG